MHFWIDKRSQCSYSGRHRVPSSLSAGVGRSRGRVGVSAHKGMAAPVHRFTPLEPPPRRHHSNHTSPPQAPVVQASRRRHDDSLYVEIPERPQPSIASLAAARSVTPDTLLRTAALGLHHSPMMAPHLKFGMLVSFALATVFLAGAKFYFDRQVSRGVQQPQHSVGEAGAVCVVAATALAASLCAALCRRRAPPPAHLPRVSTTATRHHQMLSASGSDDTTLSGPRPAPAPPAPPSPVQPAPLLSSPPPPPYHIAVLLPPRPPAPPPHYSSLAVS